MLTRSLTRQSNKLFLRTTTNSTFTTISPTTKQQLVRTKYSDKVIDHYKNPRNTGSLDKSSPNVGTGIVGAPACGDVMKFQVQIGEDGRVIDAKFKTFGCGSAIASSSLATEWVKGKSIEDCGKITNQDIASYLALPPVKKHCSLLAEQAIRAAIDDYRKKHENAEESQQQQQQQTTTTSQ